MTHLSPLDRLFAVACFHGGLERNAHLDSAKPADHSHAVWNLGRLTISQKLIGLIATLMTLIVGVLTAYFPSRQIAELNRGLVSRADTYGALLSHQLAPAVAFRDRETAREVLGSISVDPDVKSGVLCLSDGRPLHAIGTAPTWVCRSGTAETARRVFAEADRIVVVSPVVSPEGPRGTVVIELETSRMKQRQRVVTITGIAVGGLALAAGVLAAWLIARSIARRLRTIVDVASAVTAGALDQKPIADASSDEIGTLARAFNAMLLRVEERTNQLATANEQLKREMEERNKIEGELLHAQKLEAVGRLASGVAHEINTPVQFVSDSVHFAKDALADLIALVGRYRAVNAAVLDGSASATSSEEVAEAEKDADLDYLIENLPSALDRSLEGLGRIATIVRSMKEFAHPDQKEMTTVNLNQAILSTLTIARNEYKYVADVETHLGDLPPVTCYAGEVNQVVLNIIVNAAHAIGDVIKGSESKGRITIRSSVDGGAVIVGISDTGTGIPEHIRARVFDPILHDQGSGKGNRAGAGDRPIRDRGQAWRRIDRAIGGGKRHDVSDPPSHCGQATGRRRDGCVTMMRRIMFVDDEQQVLDGLRNLLRKQIQLDRRCGGSCPSHKDELRPHGTEPANQDPLR